MTEALSQLTALNQLFQRQRAYRSTVKKTTYQERIDKLKGLEEALHTHRYAIHQALEEDLGKPPEETDLTEISVVLGEIAHACKNLKNWMTPQQVKNPLKLIGTKSEICVEPKGTSLIIAPWNYPLNLMLGPLVSAIAAGNTVILKPSEHAPQTAQLLEWLISELFSPEEIAVVEGDVEVSKALLELPFDHIFFTGSTAVGKLVMKAAARHLSSVTLELGGKSPVIVDESAHISSTAERIAYGKFSNAGQTCIAPDYVLVHESVIAEFKEALKPQIQRFYALSNDGLPEKSVYTRIINDKHLDRLSTILLDATEKGAEVVVGGTVNATSRYIAPTVLTNISDDMQLMQEEIFGPLLPILEYTDQDQAIEHINSKPNPLALYIFSHNGDAVDYIIDRTTSGSIAINETLIQFANPDLPFGGVNQSGIGKAHGYYGFLAFSNERSVLRQRAPRSPLKFFYPPYSTRTRTFIDYLIKYL